ASPGRGHYAESREGARLIAECRARINTLIGGESPAHVVFTLNTSDALNLAIKGAVRRRRLDAPGRPIHLVSTDMDHNSVLRPYAALAEEPEVSVTFVGADPGTGMVRAEDVAAAITPDTLLVSVVHVSNVSGAIQPIVEIGRLCRAKGVLYLIDAAQSLGHVPFDARSSFADLVAFPGHKGLMGPQGTGGLYIRPGVEGLIATTREGGTGHLSELEVQPDEMPQKFEAGSHNTIGIVGLSEGVRWLNERGQDVCRRHELELIGVMLDELRAGGARTLESPEGSGPLAGLTLLGPADPSQRCGTFSFTHDTLSPGEIVLALEEGFGVLARAGIHCAPRAHGTLGSLRSGGAARMSVGPFVTPDDVRTAARALREICASVTPA
ncbi:MAG: aminotransferase class V-fold PLP-dependent enzyme, partial [Phycisphaerales bacterium]